jgi:hypothetical protein
MGLSVLVVAVVTVGALSLSHRTPNLRSGGPAASGSAALVKRLAVLRRAQTPADRTYPPYLAQRGRSGRAGVIMKLTRLAATVSTPTVGQVRVYVTVRRLPARRIYSPARTGADAVSAVAVAGHGANGSGPITATMLDMPNAVGGGLASPGAGLDPNRGVTVGIVPDGVTRVKWVFSGAAFGVTRPRPLTIYPRVQSNVAVAAVKPSQGPLVHATWYGPTGQAIASAGPGLQARQHLQQIAAVNATRRRAIAPLLLSHYSLFRSIAPDDLTRDWRLPTPGTEGGYVGQMELNYWQTRYVPSVTGLDGPGLWITPGSRGLCISDPQAGDCGKLTTRAADGIIGGGTSDGHQQSISGLVPDGNSTITLVLADGTRKTVPVVDHNVYEATVSGQIIAIINRDITGHVHRRALG